MKLFRRMNNENEMENETRMRYKRNMKHGEIEQLKCRNRTVNYNFKYFMFCFNK